MENNYLITLTPLGKFYFGGDATFRINDKKFDEEYSSYIIESRKFPQQTSLLGMLRYLLLSHDSEAFDIRTERIINTEKAKELIGEKGFCVNGGREGDFKCIKSLSPCFLQVRNKREESSWQTLLPAPRDFGYALSFDSSMKCYVNGMERDTPVMAGYDPKKQNELFYLGEKEQIKESEIFCRDVRVGIDRDFEGRTKDNAFYKQICYRLGKQTDEREYRYAFYTCVEMDLTAYNGSIVSVGGDGSYFVFQAEKVESIALSLSYEAAFSCEQKLILLSDAYLEQSEAEQVKFAMTETVPFRFLKTTVDAKSYSILNKEVRRSEERYRLYQRGSVFFGDATQIENLKQALEKRKDFFQIGYNHYQIISNKK